MTDRSLLVLAASREQVDAIRTAIRLGYRVVTVDNIPSNPGHSIANASFDVDTRDIDGVLAVARKERVAGLLAFATDVAVPTAAAVANALGLRGVPPSATSVLCGKHAFRAFLTSVGLPTPRYLPLGMGRLPSIRELGPGPWVLKPERSSGSKGVYIAASEEEVRRQVAETLAFDPAGQGIIEAFVSGRQGSCEGWVRGGRLERAFVLDRVTVEPPHTATAGHRYPAALGARAERELRRQLDLVVGNLGIESGPFDCDFVSQGDEIVLLEVTPRLGGNWIWRLIRSVCGIDLLELAIRHACGEDVAIPPVMPSGAGAIHIFGVPRKGHVFWDADEFERLAGEQWCRGLEMDVPIGSVVEAFTSGRHRLGSAIVVGSSPSDVELRSLDLRTRLSLGTT